VAAEPAATSATGVTFEEALAGVGPNQAPDRKAPSASASEAGVTAAPAAPGAGSPAKPDATGGPLAPAASSPSSADHATLERAAAVLRQVQAELRPGARRVQVDLDPPELGRLSIRVAMQEGKVTAVVRAESAATLGLLERQAPELQAAMRAAGVDVGALSLELASNHSHGHGFAREREGRLAPLTPSIAAVGDQGAGEPRIQRTRPSNAGDGVDTYA